MRVTARLLGFVLISALFSGCVGVPNATFDTKKPVEIDRSVLAVDLRQDGKPISSFDAALELGRLDQTAPMIRGFWGYSVGAVVVAGAAVGFVAGSNPNRGVVAGTLFLGAIGLANLSRQKLDDAVEMHNRSLSPATALMPIVVPVDRGAVAGMQYQF